METQMSTETNQARRHRLDSEQGLLLTVFAIVLLGAAAVLAIMS
jgi:hypothetical protein